MKKEIWFQGPKKGPEIVFTDNNILKVDTHDERGVIELDINDIIGDYIKYLKNVRKIYDEDKESTYRISESVFQELFDEMISHVRQANNLHDMDLPKEFLDKLKSDFKLLFEIEN
ncbi:MAG: hypothetical protein GF349_01780 [Candidatus Magasanikbacteria bacterium]|nr:hypothetical protein [Candidatus Magasanikbacteria bacterium]